MICHIQVSVVVKYNITQDVICCDGAGYFFSLNISTKSYFISGTFSPLKCKVGTGEGEVINYLKTLIHMTFKRY